MGKEKNMFILAHPDDETIVAGLSKRINDSKKETTSTWIWTTNSSSNTPDKREEESIKAMSVLGIRRDKLVFLRNSDVHIRTYIKDDNDKYAADFFGSIKNCFVDIIDIMRPEKVYVGAYEGGNITHDIVNLLVKNAVDELNLGIKLIEFPQYHLELPYYKTELCGTEVPIPHVGRFYHSKKDQGQNGLDDKAIGMKDGKIILTPKELELKLELAECYPSQKQQIKLMVKKYTPEKAKAEVYREVPKDRDYMKKPNGDNIPLFYEVYTEAKYEKNGITFDDFLRIVKLVDKI